MLRTESNVSHFTLCFSDFSVVRGLRLLVLTYSSFRSTLLWYKLFILHTRCNWQTVIANSFFFSIVLVNLTLTFYWRCLSNGVQVCHELESVILQPRTITTLFYFVLVFWLIFLLVIQCYIANHGEFFIYQINY